MHSIANQMKNALSFLRDFYADLFLIDDTACADHSEWLWSERTE